MQPRILIAALVIAANVGSAQTVKSPFDKATVPGPTRSFDRNIRNVLAARADLVIRETLLDHRDQLRWTNTALSAGQIVVSVYQTWNDSIWENSTRDSIVFNNNGHETDDVSQGWDGSGWVNSARYTFTFDTNGHETDFLFQTWNDSVWVNDDQSILTYDANGHKSSSLSQTWTGSAWVNSYLHTYTYDSNGLLSSYLGQSWNGTGWVNLDLASFVYDSSRNVTDFLGQTWSGSAWVNSSRYSFTYDRSGREAGSLSQSWNGSSWANAFMNSFTYDLDGNVTSELIESWSGSAWVNSHYYTFSYDGDRHKTGSMLQSWNGSEWVNVWRSISTWQQVTAVEERPTAPDHYSLSDNYPNPFNPSTHISFTLPRESHVSLVVFDMLGRKVVTLVNEEKRAGEHSVEWNAGGIASGVYFYRLAAGTFVAVKKMVIVR